MFSKFVGALIASAGLLSGLVQADTVETFGVAPNAWSPRISPDGKNVAMGCSPGGVTASCIYNLEGGAPIVFNPGDDYRVSRFYWASNDHLISIISYNEKIRTSSGLRDFRINRALSYNIKTKKSAILMRDRKGYSSLVDVTSLCRDIPDKIAMEITVKRGRGYSSKIGYGLDTMILSVDLDSGRSKFIEGGDVQSVITYEVDNNCKPIVRVLFDDYAQTYGIQLVEDRRTLLERTDVITVPMSVIGLSADNESLLLRIYDQDEPGIYSLSLDDGTLERLKVNGEDPGDPGAILDDHTNSVVGFTYEDDLVRQVFIDPLLDEIKTVVESVLPDRMIRITSWSTDRTKFTIAAETAGKPVDFYLFDTTAGEMPMLASAATGLETVTLSVPQPISYEARDGLSIPAYLTLPPGKTDADGPFPLILMPHGGPESRDNASYDWWAQALAQEGYAVLQPNFRGSDGYGISFREAGFGEFGGKMITDIIDGATYLQAEGIASPGGACITGASYGGYAALMAPLLDPDMIGCAIAVAPVTDIFNHMGQYGIESSGYNYWSRYVGGDLFSTASAKANVTPASRTSDYTTPLLILHGKDDKIVETTQSQAFNRRWGNRDGLKYLELKDEGHDLTSTAVRTILLEESLEFLAEHHPVK